MNYVVFDVETTGTGSKDEVVQFSALLLNEKLKLQKVYNCFCSTQVTMDPEAARITGLDAKLLRELSKGKFFEDFYCTSDLFKLKDVVWCGYNVEFDIGKVNNTLTQNGLDAHDFGRETKRLNKNEGSYYFDVMKLYSVAKRIDYYESLSKSARSLSFSQEKLEAMYAKLLQITNCEFDSKYHNALYDSMITWLLLERNRNLAL